MLINMYYYTVKIPISSTKLMLGFQGVIKINTIKHKNINFNLP